MKTLNETIRSIENTPARSAWARGVKEYALELLEDVSAERWAECTSRRELRRLLLNGAEDWSMYSYGGCSLIYNADICERLSNPTEQKRTNYGEKRPNAHEEWLDTQARALRQAAEMIGRHAAWIRG